MHMQMPHSTRTRYERRSSKSKFESSVCAPSQAELSLCCMHGSSCADSNSKTCSKVYETELQIEKQSKGLGGNNLEF